MKKCRKSDTNDFPHSIDLLAAIFSFRSMTFFFTERKYEYRVYVISIIVIVNTFELWSNDSRQEKYKYFFFYCLHQLFWLGKNKLVIKFVSIPKFLTSIKDYFKKFSNFPFLHLMCFISRVTTILTFIVFTAAFQLMILGLSSLSKVLWWIVGITSQFFGKIIVILVFINSF